MRADWPVVGRDDELAAIGAGLRRGVGCVVVGEPGVGKTIVLRELRRRLAAAGRDSQLVLVTTAAQSSMPQYPIPAADPAAGDGPAVLLIDDAHLLDPAAAAQVGHQAMNRATTSPVPSAALPPPSRPPRPSRSAPRSHSGWRPPPWSCTPRT